VAVEPIEAESIVLRVVGELALAMRRNNLNCVNPRMHTYTKYPTCCLTEHVVRKEECLSLASHVYSILVHVKRFPDTFFLLCFMGDRARVRHMAGARVV
jgi:hypothetical protein